MPIPVSLERTMDFIELHSALRVLLYIEVISVYFESSKNIPPKKVPKKLGVIIFIMCSKKYIISQFCILAKAEHDGARRIGGRSGCVCGWIMAARRRSFGVITPRGDPRGYAGTRAF